VHYTIDTAQPFLQNGSILKATFNPFMLDAGKLLEVLPRPHEQAQPMTGSKPRHECTRHKTAGAGNKAEGTHREARLSQGRRGNATRLVFAPGPGRTSCVSTDQSSPPIRAVLFDVDGTLYHARPMRIRMAASLLMLPLRGPFRAMRVMRHLRGYRHALEEIRDYPPSDDNVADVHLKRAAELAGDEPERVWATVQDWFMKRPLPHLKRCRRDGLLPFLEQLREDGCKIGFFSDYPVEAKLDAMEIREFASVCLSASDPEVNALKPRPRGLERACEMWGLSPAEVLYVGDRPEVDAAGATAAGMRCVIIGSKGREASPETFVPVADFNELGELLKKGL